MIERAFARLAEGQMHLRQHVPAEPTGEAMLLFHASPASSWSLEGLMGELARGAPGLTLIAPDTLGNGDSPPPQPETPDIAYFAESMLRLADSLGLQRVHVYGSHTGARIACEFAATYPDRVGRVVLDGITEYDDDMRNDIIANYAPVVAPDDHGGQYAWAFNFVRDQAFYFPYFRRDAKHRLAGAMPPAAVIHRVVLDVLKTLGTYSKPYLAAFRYKAFARMDLIKAPVLLLKPDTELPILNAAVAKAAEHLQDAQIATFVGGDKNKAEVMLAFLGQARP